MEFSAERRNFVSAAGQSAVLALPCVAGFYRNARAQAAVTAPVTQPLRNGLSLITGAGGNVVVARQRDSLALVDTGAPQSAASVVSAVAELAGGLPVQTVLNTHWHTDHTGGNAEFARAGASICAHENTRLWMSTQFYVRWQDQTYLPREAAALPTTTFFSSDPQPRSIDLGALHINYAHLPNAHTDGDIFVFFPDANIMVGGGAVASGRYPIMDFATGGWIDGLIEATRMLISLVDDDTLIVPGQGEALRKPTLEAQLDMVSTLRTRIAERMRLGKSVDEMMAEGVTDDFDKTWGEGGLGRQFVANAYADLAWRGPGNSL